MLVGWYPISDDGHGLVSIVCTTLSVLVLMTETVSSFVFATNSAPAFFFAAVGRKYIAVGCSPTLMVPTAGDGCVVSMTLTVPVVDVPRYELAGTWMP